MAHTWIITKNLWRSASLTSSSDNPEFPAENTRDDSPQLYWQSAAAALAPNIVGDLGAALPYNFVAIRGHNLTAGATQIDIKGADNAAMTTNPVTDSLTFYGNNIYQKLTATRTKRYVQFLFADSGNPSNYIKAANLIVGLAVDLGRQYTIGSSHGYLDESEQQKTPSGFEALVQAHSVAELRRYKWPGLSDTVAAYIRALQLSGGITRAFLLCLDSATPNTTTLWVKTPALILPLRDGPNNHTWDPGDLQEVL